MDLSSFLLNQNETDYSTYPKRKYAIEFFSNLADDSKISQEQWKSIIQLGEDIYWSTFEDSDYIKGIMNFKPIKEFSPELKKHLLNYIHRNGNYIVKLHVEDYLKEEGS